MALLWCDGFDSYASTSDLSNNWSSVSSPWAWGSTTGHTGAGGISCATAGSQTEIHSPTSLWSVASGSLIGYCFRLKIASAPSGGMWLLHDNGNNVLGVSSSGYLQFIGNSALRVTGTTSVCDGSWHEIMYLNAGSSGGRAAAWIDGTSDWDSTYTMSSVSRTQITLYGFTSGGTVSISDIWVIDSNTPTPNTGQMPYSSGLITTLRPTSDSSVQFTPDSGGTNYTQVDDVGADDDTSYVEDGTSSDADEYGYSNLGFTPTEIESVQITTRLKNTGAGSINYKARCVSGATTSDGTSTAVNATYTNDYRVLDQDPNTSSAWTKTNLEAADFGYTVV